MVPVSTKSIKQKRAAQALSVYPHSALPVAGTYSHSAVPVAVTACQVLTCPMTHKINSYINFSFFCTGKPYPILLKWELCNIMRKFQSSFSRALWKFYQQSTTGRQEPNPGLQGFCGTETLWCPCFLADCIDDHQTAAKPDTTPPPQLPILFL